MAVIYIPDELMHRILDTGINKQMFVKKAIEEKLKRGYDK